MADICFASFRFDTTNQQLWNGDELVPLRPQSLTVLHYLTEHPERFVPTHELLSACWQDVQVGANNVKVCIKDIRKALGDTVKTPIFIKNKPRHGYRFIGTLTPQSCESDSSASPSFRASASQCVGREAELQQLQTCLEHALAGKRQIVFVTGEPGIGKTTLVTAFLKRVADRTDLRIISGQCREQYGIEETYQAVREGLDQLSKGNEGPTLLPFLRQHAPMWLAQLPSLLSPAERITLQQELLGATGQRMLREFTTAVELLSAERGLILVLEDLHWSDVSTLHLVSALAQRRDPARLLIIGTFRPMELQHNGHPLRQMTAELFLRGAAQEVPLQFLTETAIAEYLATRITTDNPLLELARLLHQRTQGNPLFLVNMLGELLKEWDEQPADHRSLTAQVQALQIPDNIRQLIDYQFDSLPLEEQQLLEAASLVGMQFSTAPVAAGIQAEMETVERACQELAQHGLFLDMSGSPSSDITTWPDGTLTQYYQFRHALYQEVLAERPTGSQRVNMHRRIGERLEAGYVDQTAIIARELALHFEQGREYQRAISYHYQAGVNALQRHAYAEAIEHFQTGRGFLTRLTDTPERDQQEIQLCVALGIPFAVVKGPTAPEIAMVYDRARELCQKSDDAPQLFPPLFGLARYYATRGELQTADQLSQRLLRLALRQQDPTLLPSAHTARGGALFFLGDLVSAQEHFAQAVALYDPQKHGSLTLMLGEDPKVVGASFESWTLWYLGYPDRALEKCHTALALAQQVSHPFNVTISQLVVTWLHYLRGAVEEMQQWADQLIRYSTEKEFLVWLAPGYILKGWTLFACGHEEAGITLIDQKFAQFQEMGAELWSMLYRILLTEVYLHMGRLADARPSFEEAFTKAKTIGEFLHTAEIHRVHGALLLAEAEGRELEAEACFQQALDIAQRQHAKSLELRAATSLARLWQQQGKTTAARQLLAEIYGWFTEGFDTADLQKARDLLDALS